MSWFTPSNQWDDILQHSPAIADKFQPFYQSYWELPQIPASTLELCRLRLAQLHQSDTEFAKENVDIPESKRAALTNWHKDPAFNDAERACLEFTEVYTMDVQMITDELAEAVKSHYGDAGLVALVQALGIFYGTTRVSQLWEL